MSLIRTITMAMTSRMWMNPPMVFAVTRPKSHRIKSIAAIVTSIKVTING